MRSKPEQISTQNILRLPSPTGFWGSGEWLYSAKNVYIGRSRGVAIGFDIYLE